MHRHAHCAGAKLTTCRQLHLRSPVDHVPPNRRSTLPIYLGNNREPRIPRCPGNLVNQATISTRSTTHLVDQLQVDQYTCQPTTPSRLPLVGVTQVDALHWLTSQVDQPKLAPSQSWRPCSGPCAGRPGPSTSSPTVAGRLHSSHPTPRSAPPKRGQGQQQLPLTEGSLEASPVVPASGIAGGRQCAKLVDKDVKPSMTGEQQTGEPVEKEAVAWVQSTGEQQTGRSTGEVSKSAGGDQPVKGSKQPINDKDVDDGGGGLSVGEESTDSDVVEVPVEKPKLRRLGRTRKPPERLVFHACLLPAAFTTVYDNVDDDRQYDDAEDDVDLPELDPDVHVDPGHRTDIATMTLKEAMASWKGKVVKATMEEEIRSLIGMGTWELVERPHGVNIMKNRWVLTTKYLIDDTVKREKARLVVKGFMQVYGADYDETYSPVSTYVTLRIFLSIVALLELNLMQLDMKNAFLQSKLDQVLYMYQPDYFDDGIDRVCKLLKSLYRLKQSPLLWYRALDGVLMGAGWKKSQVATALYFKGGDNGVTCWVLVYVDNLLAASSNTAMLKELKELLEAAFELREISPVIKNLGLEIICDRPSRKLRRRFTNEEQIEHISKTPVSVDACAELTFDDEEAQEREDEDKLGSGLTVRSDQHWLEVDRCLAYLAVTRDTALELGGGLESLELIDYVDTDDAGDKQNRTSTGGYVFVFGGAAVS
ncbi:unnamed protein product [Closterium sp. NIES-53]